MFVIGRSYLYDGYTERCESIIRRHGKQSKCLPGIAKENKKNKKEERRKQKRTEKH